MLNCTSAQGSGWLYAYIYIGTTTMHSCTVPIVEETLTSGEYISLFLISILNIYILENRWLIAEVLVKWLKQ